MQPHRSSALDGGWCCRCSDSGMDAHTCCGRATVMWPWSHIILRAARERPAPAFVDTLRAAPRTEIYVIVNREPVQLIVVTRLVGKLVRVDTNIYKLSSLLKRALKRRDQPTGARAGAPLGGEEASPQHWRPARPDSQTC